MKKVVRWYAVLILMVMVVYSCFALVGCKNLNEHHAAGHVLVRAEQKTASDISLTKAEKKSSSDESLSNQLFCDKVYAKYPLKLCPEEWPKNVICLQYMFDSPSCFSEDERMHADTTTARAWVRQFTEDVSPDALRDNPSYQLFKTYITENEKNTRTGLVASLTDVYILIDQEKPDTLLNMMRAYKTARDSSLMDHVVEQVFGRAIQREVYVYLFRHSTESLANVEEAFKECVFQSIENRIVFAKEIVRRFEELDTRTLPPAFLDEFSHEPGNTFNKEVRKELLSYAISPHDNDLQYLDTLDARAQLYVEAGYDVTEVQAAVANVLEKKPAIMLAYAHRHSDDQRVMALETQVMNQLRKQGCYSILEDADGHKMRLYDFSSACAQGLKEDEEDE